MSKRDDAVQLLTHYIRRVWVNTGNNWTSDNDAEIRDLIDAIIQAAIEP